MFLPTLTERPNFSRQQTDEEFKTGIRHDAFQHLSDEGPKNHMEELEEDKPVDDDEDSDAEEEKEDEDGDNEEEDEDQSDPSVELSGDTDVLLHRVPDEEEPQEEESEEEGVDEADIQTPSASSSVKADTESRIHTMTKRGSKKRFSFRLRNMGVPVCVLFLVLLDASFSKETYDVFSEGIVAGGIAAHELRSSYLT